MQDTSNPLGNQLVLAPVFMIGGIFLLLMAIGMVLDLGQRTPAGEASAGDLETAHRVTFGIQAVTISGWDGEGPPTRHVRGRLMVDGEPVSGALVAVDGQVLDQPTGEDGTFIYAAGAPSEPHTLTVVDASGAFAGGREMTEAQRQALQLATSHFEVIYEVTELSAD